MKKLACLVMALCLSVAAFGCASEEGKTGSGNLPDINATTGAKREEASRAVSSAVGVVKVTGDGVNVRASASTEGEIYGQADQGDYYLFKATEGSWNKIVYDGKEAFISADYSSVEQVSETEAGALIGGNTESSDSEENSEESSASSEESSEESTGGTEASSAPESSDESGSKINAGDIRGSEDGQAR